MMLKKQTVWLLTMLSLVVVLSVYYIMSPQGENAVTVEDTKSKGTEEKKVETEKGTDKGADKKSTDKETNGKQEDIETSGEEGKAVSEQTDDELLQHTD